MEVGADIVNVTQAHVFVNMNLFTDYLNDILGPCSPNPCKYGGRCTRIGCHYKCRCHPSKKGERCQYDVNECNSNPCQNGATCNNGYNSYSCSCDVGYNGTNCQKLVVGYSTFELIYKNKTWPLAKQHCEGLYGRLAEIHDQETNTRIQEFRNMNPGNMVWIGGSDSANEGTWMWATSGIELNLTYWNPGEPNNINNENCLTLKEHSTSGQYGWNDAGCSSRSWHFICEYLIN